jgi:2-polyprenyl-6-methoxyphenol hydroxylase-like FAD-dependent oxidoreductase
LGLTTGILDAAITAKSIIAIVVKKAANPDVVLDRYASARRAAFLSFTNPESINFKLRLHSMDQQTAEARNSFFDLLNTNPDVVQEIAKGMNKFLEDDLDEDLLNAR